VTSIELFFDIGSPYSYLCATQIGGIAAKHECDVRWRPFLLGAVFKAAGNDMPARVPAKARWMLQDLAMWAAHYGVSFSFPSLFPVNSLKAMRACAFAESKGKTREVATSLFAAYWTQGADPSSEGALRQASAAAALDPAEVLAEIETQPIKDALRASTEEAVSRGAFGAPTIFFGDTMLWGNDRLLLLDELLANETK